MAKIFGVLAASILLGASAAAQAPTPGQRIATGPAPTPIRGVESTRWDGEANLRMSASFLFGWKVGLAASTFPDLSLFTTLEHTDALNVSSLDASSLQKVNIVIPKNVDDNLQAGEIQAIQQKLLR